MIGNYRKLLKLGTIYTLLIATIAVLFFSVEFIIEKAYSNDEIVDIFTAILGTFVFARFRTSFEMLTDHIFFRGEYDYAEAVNNLGQILGSTIELAELLKLVENFLMRTIKPKYVVFSFDSKATPRSDGVATMSLFSKNEMFAVMSIGEKLSGEELSLKDKQLLDVVSRQAGMAIENARLYEALRGKSEDLERRVAEKTERIREMHDAQSRFLMDVAHEFQTPIAILKGNLETIAENGTVREKHAFYVADTTLDRLSRLVANLLDVARLQFSKEKFEKQPVDVKALIEAAYDDCLTLAEHHKISLSHESENILVFGDKEKLKEVLLNLVSNALKHTPAGGSISLAAKKSGEDAEISVSDTGRGISPENLSLVFERFYQIGGERNRRGTGLGLHICRQIVEAHHGTITAESDVGKGSRFVVRIPLKLGYN